MLLVYDLCFLLSLFIYIWLLLTDVKRSLNQNIMVLILVVSSLGYITLSCSHDLGEAILSQKLIYIGGCYIPVLYFLIVAEICHIHIKRRIILLLLLAQTALFACVCTIGYSDLYYTHVSLSTINGISVLSRSYGPAHAFYPISMFGYYLASVYLVVISGLKNKAVNRRELYFTIGCTGLAFLVYLIQRALPEQVELTVFSDIVLIIGAVVPIYHSNLYTVHETKMMIQEQINSVGFITFDKKLRFMGCNDYAVSVFDELGRAKVGESLKEYGRELTRILEGVEEFGRNPENQAHLHESFIQFQIRDRFYESEIHTVSNAFKRCVGYTVIFEDETEHYRVLQLTNHYNEELTKEVDEKTSQIRTIQEKIILGMAQMVESRDSSTGGHIKRTSDVVRIFSKKLQQSSYPLDETFLNLVIRSAPMHDLGKIGVDDAILRKNGKFTDEEYSEMKKHAAIGGQMVGEILTGVEEEDFVRVAKNVANYHHEKVNGKGYPEGLMGDQIPVEARIMALADVFDALVSKRCYKEAFSYDKAFNIIKKDAGSHFDAELAEIFLSCREELEEYYNNN